MSSSDAPDGSTKSPLSISSEAIKATLLRLVSDYQDMNGTHFQAIEGPPSALEFAKLLHLGRPVLIKGLARTIPAFDKWDAEYLTTVLGEQQIGVSVTPDGNADALVEDEAGITFIAEPHSETMKMGEFLEKLKAHSHSEVLYLQSQNGNLRSPDSEETEYAALRDDVPASFAFASDALGQEPDAVNLWIGGSHSQTSLHKDPYENLYAVLRGSKTFTVLPPTEGILLGTQLYPHASYHRPSPTSPLTLVPTFPSSPTTPTVPWTPVNPIDETTHTSLYQDFARPITIRVEEGDGLYLPFGWYHFVTQEPGEEGFCSAVNWWYDGEYRGERWSMREMMDRLAREVGWSVRPPGAEEEEEEEESGEEDGEGGGEEVEGGDL